MISEIWLFRGGQVLRVDSASGNKGTYNGQTTKHGTFAARHLRRVPRSSPWALLVDEDGMDIPQAVYRDDAPPAPRKLE
ncbi:hypothetical protein [Streptomyces hundungensis]|uniref:hypothetical protein n=1 Tax=Streptomyces hundungensis TaxID=1077946 RepID=UPI0013C432CC|nr:hypothetical protein [Streptomyces hundungensis]